MADNSGSRSNLIALGILLMLLGIVGPGLAARVLGEAPSVASALLIDGLRLCFFIGVAVLLIGIVRRRKRALAAKNAG